MFWADKIEDRIILDQNAQQIFGYRVGQYPHVPLTDHLKVHAPIFCETTQSEALRSYEATLDMRDDVQSDRVRRIANANGNLLWLRLIERTLVAQDGRSYMSGTVMDVTPDVDAFIYLWTAKALIVVSEQMIDAATQASRVGL